MLNAESIPFLCHSVAYLPSNNLIILLLWSMLFKYPKEVLLGGGGEGDLIISKLESYQLNKFLVKCTHFFAKKTTALKKKWGRRCKLLKAMRSPKTTCKHSSTMSLCAVTSSRVREFITKTQRH